MPVVESDEVAGATQDIMDDVDAGCTVHMNILDSRTSSQ